MKLIINAVLATCFWSFCTTTPSGLQGRIIGGSIANKPYNFMAQLHLDLGSLAPGQNHFICSSTIYDQEGFLTAAHCTEYGGIQFKESQYTVYVGSEKLNEGTQYKIKKIIRHPDFNNITFDNDIAILVPCKPIVMTRNVGKVTLDTNVIAANTLNTAVGWGYTTAKPPIWSFSPDLRTLDQKVMSNAACSTLYGRRITDGQLCTFRNKQTGVCNGDSGGPLLVNNQQIAIVSGGLDCLTKKPDLFTRISHYTGWIYAQKIKT